MDIINSGKKYVYFLRDKIINNNKKRGDGSFYGYLRH